MEEWDGKLPGSMGETVLSSSRPIRWRKSSTRRLILLGAGLSLPLVILIVILSMMSSHGPENQEGAVNPEVGQNTGPDASEETPLPPNYVSIPKTDLWLPKPDGFSIDADSPGLVHQATGASVTVIRLKTPFERMRPSITPESIKNQGLEMLDQRSVKVDDREGILVCARQKTKEYANLNWRLVFGDDQGCYSLIASFPEHLEADLSEALRETLLGAKTRRGSTAAATADLGFLIDIPAGLKFVRREDSILVYTRDGKPVKSAGEPLCLVGYVQAPPSGTDQKQFSGQLLTQTGWLSRVTIQESSSTMVDGVPGYELEALASDTKGQVPMMAYQLTLFHKDRCYFIQGLISDRYESHYLPAFRMIAHSFRQR